MTACGLTCWQRSISLVNVHNPIAVELAILEIFRQSLHMEPPAVSTDLFDDSGLDSLMFITFLDALERHFDILFELENLPLEEFQTISAIANHIHRHKQENSKKKADEPGEPCIREFRSGQSCALGSVRKPLLDYLED